MGLCQTCADKACYGYSERTRECEDFRAETNYDRLISKTTEELADFIEGDPMRVICPNNCHDDLDRPCKVCVLAWLKQEAVE